MTLLTKENHFSSCIKAGIYVITCQNIHKHYVGQSQTVRARLNAHKNKLRRGLHDNKKLQKDFNLFGEENFLFQPLLLGKGAGKKERLILETSILETLLPENRYNIYINWYHRQDSKLNPFYNKIHTKAARKLQSEANKKKPSFFLGRKQSNKVKEIVSRSNAGISDRRKPVLINGAYYESISQAFQQTGLSRRLIRQRCHSTEERFFNYAWVSKQSNVSNVSNAFDV